MDSHNSNVSMLIFKLHFNVRMNKQYLFIGTKAYNFSYCLKIKLVFFFKVKLQNLKLVVLIILYVFWTRNFTFKINENTMNFSKIKNVKQWLLAQRYLIQQMDRQAVATKTITIQFVKQVVLMVRDYINKNNIVI